MTAIILLIQKCKISKHKRKISKHKHKISTHTAKCLFLSEIAKFSSAKFFCYTVYCSDFCIVCNGCYTCFHLTSLAELIGILKRQKARRSHARDHDSCMATIYTKKIQSPFICACLTVQCKDSNIHVSSIEVVTPLPLIRMCTLHQ